jgi:hypothetical protein
MFGKKIPGVGKLGKLGGKIKGKLPGLGGGWNMANLGLSLFALSGIPSKAHAGSTAAGAAYGSYLGAPGALIGAGIGGLVDTYNAGNDTKNVLGAARAALKSGDLDRMKTAQQALLAQSQKLATGGGSQNMNRAITFLTGRLGDFESLNFKLQTEVRLWQSKTTQQRNNRRLFGLKPTKAPKYQTNTDTQSYGNYGSVWKDMGIKLPPKSIAKPAPILPAFMQVPKNVQASVDGLGHSADVSKRKVDNLKFITENLLKSGGVLRIDADTSKAMNKINNVLNTIQHPLTFFLGAGGLFTGGVTEPGKGYWTGEMGQEAWVSRSGNIKMLGANGPEFVKPGAGAVIPASATARPGTGATGLAPEWAIDTYRKAVAGAQVTKPSRGAGNASTGEYGPLPSINIGPNHFSSEVDVENAVKKAWRDYEKERQERK